MKTPNSSSVSAADALRARHQQLSMQIAEDARKKLLSTLPPSTPSNVPSGKNDSKGGSGIVPFAPARLPTDHPGRRSNPQSWHNTWTVCALLIAMALTFDGALRLKASRRQIQVEIPSTKLEPYPKRDEYRALEILRAENSALRQKLSEAEANENQLTHLWDSVQTVLLVGPPGERQKFQLRFRLDQFRFGFDDKQNPTLLLVQNY